MIERFFIFGLGYTAQTLVRKLLSQNIEVIGTSRRPESYSQTSPHVTCIHFDAQDIASRLADATHILVCIPPTTQGLDPVMEKYGALIAKQCSKLKWLGYLSSTGVYGDHAGSWVDENSLCQPHTPTAMARLKVEQAWLSYARNHQLPLHIFRLSGIYGPQRNIIERLLAGKRYSIFKENQVFSRIHVEDIAHILLASIQQPKPGSIYNVSDDEPASAHLVDAYAAKLLGRQPLPLIPYAEANLSPMEREFYENNRRVSNLKIKKELHIILKYPTYREGLNMIWRTQIEPQ